MLGKIDKGLFDHFHAVGIESHFIPIHKWFATLFCQEFPIDTMMILFDALLTQKKKSAFIKCLCTAALTLLRDELLQLDDVTLIVKKVQNLQRLDIIVLITKAVSILDSISPKLLPSELSP